MDGATLRSLRRQPDAAIAEIPRRAAALIDRPAGRRRPAGRSERRRRLRPVGSGRSASVTSGCRGPSPLYCGPVASPARQIPGGVGGHHGHARRPTQPRVASSPRQTSRHPGREAKIDDTRNGPPQPRGRAAGQLPRSGLSPPRTPVPHRRRPIAAASRSRAGLNALRLMLYGRRCIRARRTPGRGQTPADTAASPPSRP